MDPEGCRRVCDSLLVARVRFLDVELLEFFERLIKHDVPVKHVFDYCFQAGAYLHLYFFLTLRMMIASGYKAEKPTMIRRPAIDKPRGNEP